MKSNGALNQVRVHFRGKLNCLANKEGPSIENRIGDQMALGLVACGFSTSASSFLTSTLHIEMTGYVRVDIRRGTTG